MIDAKRDWIAVLNAAVDGFCETAPMVFAEAGASAHVMLHARRLQIAFGSLRDAPFEKQLPAEAVKLIEAGAARIRTLQRELTAASFAAPLTSLASLNELALVERLRAAPIEDVYRIARVIIAAPSELAVFDQISRAALFAELGITVQLGIFEWIKLILLALCFVVLAIFGAAALPFVLFVAAALAAIDKAGEIIPKEGAGAAGGGGGGPNPPAGGGTGPTVIHYDDGDIIYPGPGGGPVLWKPKNGPPQVIWPQPEPSPVEAAWSRVRCPHCSWIRVYPHDGKRHKWRVTFTGPEDQAGSIDHKLELRVQGGSTITLRPGQSTEIEGVDLQIHYEGEAGKAGLASVALLDH